MKTLRPIIVLLLSIALPFQVTANLIQDLNCPADGLAAQMAGPMQHADHGASLMAMDTDHEQPAAADRDCVCPQECSCARHCLNAGGCALASLASFGLAAFAGRERQLDLDVQLAASPPRTSVFRPPITVSASAA